MNKKKKLRKTEADLISYELTDPIFEGSKINLIEMSAAYKAAELVLESRGVTPTPEQIILFSVVASVNALKNSLPV